MPFRQTGIFSDRNPEDQVFRSVVTGKALLIEMKKRKFIIKHLCSETNINVEPGEEGKTHWYLVPTLPVIESLVRDKVKSIESLVHIKVFGAGRHIVSAMIWMSKNEQLSLKSKFDLFSSRFLLRNVDHHTVRNFLIETCVQFNYHPNPNFSSRVDKVSEHQLTGMSTCCRLWP